MKLPRKKYWFTIETVIETNYSIVANDIDEATKRVESLQNHGVVGDHGVLWDNVMSLREADEIKDEWLLREEGNQILEERVADISEHI